MLTSRELKLTTKQCRPTSARRQCCGRWKKKEIDLEKKVSNKLLKCFFNQLNRFLKDRYLPNFFYPSVNLLESYPEELIDSL